jgi:hypothetical protein
MESINSRRKVFLKIDKFSLGQDIYHFLLNITSSNILSFTVVLCYCHSTVHCHNLRSTLTSHELFFPFILPDINFHTFPISHIFFVFACLYALFNVSAIRPGFTTPRCLFVQIWIRMYIKRKDPRLILFNTPGIFLEVSRGKKRIMSNRRSPGHFAS